MIEVTNGANRLKLFKSNRLVGLKGSLNSIKNQKLKEDKDLLSFGGFTRFNISLWDRNYIIKNKSELEMLLKFADIELTGQ